MIRPLAGRVLIQPDSQATETASGLAIPDSHFEYEMSGTVVKIGNGPASAHRVRMAILGRVKKIVEEVPCGLIASGPLCDVLDAIRELEHQSAHLSEVVEGDRVAFPYTAGTVMEVDGQRYLLMNEDQIVAVLEAE